MANGVVPYVQQSIYATRSTTPPLEERFYSLKDEELAFYKSQTGIEDEETLKRHIIAVQTKAYNVYAYFCIRSFSFTRLKISRLPAYKSILKLARERKDAILLDIGCCFGNDVRKAVVDGWPASNVIASDICQEFWNFGHELFRSTPKTFPATFIAGDAFDSAIIAPRAPFYDKPLTPRPELNSLNSLTPLQGHISAIHASSFFHLFDEKNQLDLAYRIASLLSPTPGSMIFGAHGGRREKGWWVEEGNDKAITMFCHSPESWAEMWNGQVFRKGSVKVEVGLKETGSNSLDNGQGTELPRLFWSVTRL